MADLDFYDVATAKSEIVNRPDQAHQVNGQAGFMQLALSLGVPIQSSEGNVELSSTAVDVGAGASGLVASSGEEFKTRVETGFINRFEGSVDWFSGFQKEDNWVTISRHVVKRVQIQATDEDRDALTLAHIVNEMRILAKQSLRRAKQITKLLFVSWHDVSISNRFWPQLVLERADHGTLADFIQHQTLDLPNQLMLATQILYGLEFLYTENVVHCDLKPGNILIFDDERQNVHGQLDYVLRPVTAKLCDFGSAVILSDYDHGKQFEAHLGTYPWTSPELELGLPTDLCDLHKTDLYTFGLIFAYILCGGKSPFGTDQAQIARAKAEGSVEALVFENIVKEASGLPEYEVKLIHLIIMFTVMPDPKRRLSIVCIFELVALAFYSITTAVLKDFEDDQMDDDRPFRGAPSGLPLALFDRFTMGSPDAKGSFAWNPLENVRHAVYNARDTLEAIYPRVTSVVASTGFGAKPARRPLDEKMQTFFRNESHGLDMAKVLSTDHISLPQKNKGPERLMPDFSRERDFRPTAFPRILAKEVFADLQNQAGLTGGTADPEAMFQLATCHFNGIMTNRDDSQGLKLLAEAARSGYSQAQATVVNAHDALNVELPQDVINSVQQPDLTDLTSHQDLLRLGGNVYENWLVGYKVARRRGLNRLKSKRYTKSLTVEEQRKSFTLHLIGLLNYWKGFNTDVETISDRLSYLSGFILYFDQLDTSTNSTQDYTTATGSKAELSTSLQQLSFISDLQEGRRLKVGYQQVKNEILEKVCMGSTDAVGLTLLHYAALRNDRELAEILVQDVKVDPNDVGETPGWTPLFTGCIVGSFEVVMFLVSHGANPAAEDYIQGSTILHLLSQFREKSQIEQLIHVCLGVGLDINLVSMGGATPLHATFCGIDHSGGQASRLLLEYGADPTKATENWSGGPVAAPISLCIRELDFNLLKEMVDAARKLGRHAALATAKLGAFHTLVLQDRFYFLGVYGKGYEKSLELILKILVEPDMLKEMSNYNSFFGSSEPVSAVCELARSHLLEALIRIDARQILQDVHVDIDYGHCLNVAVERRSKECALALLNAGLRLLDVMSESYWHTATSKTQPEVGKKHVLHVAAQYYPEFLSTLIEKLEAEINSVRTDRTVRDFLETRSDTNVDVIGTLLCNGYRAEQRIAEGLRKKYEIAYDRLIPVSKEDSRTMTGTLLLIFTRQHMIPIDSLRYLLNLKPQPRFICESIGTTLLQILCLQDRSFSLPEKHGFHQLTKLVLEKYPDVENLKHGGPVTVFHKAAEMSNHHAINLILRQVKQRAPEQFKSLGDIMNRHEEQTALDLALSAFMYGHPGSEAKLTGVARRKQREAAQKCYVALREAGGIHTNERQGFPVKIFFLWVAATPLTLVEGLMKDVTQAFALDEPIIEQDVLKMVPEERDEANEAAAYALDPRLRRATSKQRVIELVWWRTNFRFRTYIVEANPVYILDLTNKHVEKRVEEAAVYFGALRGYGDAAGPWRQTEYTHNLEGEGTLITWRRGGREWTDEEYDSLREVAGAFWDHKFKAIEKACIDKRGKPKMFVTYD